MAGGNVTVTAGAATLAVIPLPTSIVQEPFFLGTILYRYANLDIPFSPNDPGLAYSYTNVLQLPHVTLAARFFNLLDEYSPPLFVDVGAVVPSLTGAGFSGQLFGCLDVRLFGAVGDGVTDDTAAVQRALDKAYQNYLAAVRDGLASTCAQSQAISGTPGAVGSTVVCIPSGVYCRVFARIFDFQNIGAPPAGSLQYPAFAQCGMVALLIDDGVTLQIDGQVILSVDLTIQNQVSLLDYNIWGHYNGQITAAVAIENRNAFVGGPFGPPGYDFTGVSYDQAIGGYETGPRNCGIRITGLGLIDCGATSNPVSTLSQMGPVGVGPGQLSMTNGLGLGAVRFCKCDESQIDSITIKNATASPGIYWGHSEHVRVFDCTFSDTIGGGMIGSAFYFDPVGPNWEGETTNQYAVLILDVLRRSEVYDNKFFFVEASVLESLCRHISVRGNAMAQCGMAGETGLYSVSDYSFLFAWVFPTTVNLDGVRSGNRFSENRGLPWKPNEWIFRGTWKVPTSYQVGDHTWQALWPTLLLMAPDGEGGVNPQVPTRSGVTVGMTGSTEPDWSSPDGSFVISILDGFPPGPWYYKLDAALNLTGLLVGFWRDRFVDTFSGDQLMMLPIQDANSGATIKIYRQPLPYTAPPILLALGIDYVLTDYSGLDPSVGGLPACVLSFPPSVTLDPTDAILMDCVGQIMWVRRGALWETYPYTGTVLLAWSGASDGELASGVQLVDNKISDNYSDGIAFGGLDHGLISHSQILRNSGAGIRDIGASPPPPIYVGPPIEYLDSPGISLVQNYCAGNFGPNLATNATLANLDNPQVTPGTVVRGGVTYTFTNPGAETPTGVVDGINTVFALNPPAGTTVTANTLVVDMNGLVQTQGSDYTVAGNMITFTTAPPIGATLYATYQYA